MPLDDMKVFNDFLYRTITEVIDQQVRLFNEASGGTIVLTTKRNVGDYTHEASFKAISGLIRRRNAYGSGAVAAVDLEQLQKNSVKVASGTPPIRFQPQQFSWIQQDPETAGVVIGEQFAEGQFQDMLNTALYSLVAAMNGVAGVKYDGTAGKATYRALNATAAKFGDRANAIRAWVLHSTPMHDLWDNALANAEELFSFGTVAVRTDPFGRRFIVTDSPALVVASPAGYRTLGLVDTAVTVEDNDDFFSNLETTNGDENISRTWQAEYTFNVGIKGYSWDTASGGHSPTTAALSTTANWDKFATSNKDTAGVMLTSD